MMLQLKRVWVQMTSDRKRFGAFCMLAFVGLLLWARLIIVSDIPRSAVAEDEEGVGVSASGPARAAHAAPSDAPDPSAALQRPRIPAVFESSPPRDPFTISHTYFPPPPPPSTEGPDLANPDKSPIKTSEDDSAGRRLADRVSAAAGRLRLEAVMSGRPVLAIISGRTYALGATVRDASDPDVSFTLTEVRERSVVLVGHGMAFELTLD